MCSEKMEKALTIREQKKIETDNKILRATISLIGEKGYKATSIRDIAKDAGVSSGLITQRFESKENLVLKALYITNKVWRDQYLSDDITAYDMLTHIIRDAKSLYELDEDGFKFIYMMSISTDAPGTFQNLQKDIFYERGIYATLKRAQDEGKLPDGNLPIMFNMFICNALRLIKDYKRAGLKMPNDENFLILIQYKDPIAEEHQLFKNNAFESIAHTFINVFYINVNTGEYRVVKVIEGIEQYVEKYQDAQEFLYEICDIKVDIKCREALKEFVDLSTVMERLGDQRLIFKDYVGIDKTTYRITFISVLDEPDKEVVLFGVQKLKENI